MKFLVIIIQVMVIELFLVLGTIIKSLVSTPIPNSMIGLVLLLCALFLNIVKLEWVETGAKWLLAELLLFFVPSAVGIVNYNEILSWKGFETIFLIGFSTIIVIGTTAFISEKIYYRKKRGALR